MKTIACLAGLLVAGSAAAQQFTYPTIEDAAKLTEKHALKFERDSVTRQGDMVRFTIRATARSDRAGPVWP